MTSERGDHLAIVAPGAYRFQGEDKTAVYYVNAQGRLQIDAQPVEGGIGYGKSTGQFFLYTAMADQGKTTAPEADGESVTIVSLPSQADGVLRPFRIWKLTTEPSTWRFGEEPK